MRILVASAFEAGSHFAHAINTVKMAEGFARLGHEVTLVCQHVPHQRPSAPALAATYGLRASVRWASIPRRIRRFSLSPNLPFSLFVLLVAYLRRPDLVYARNFMVPWVSPRFGIPSIVESHAHVGERNPVFLRLARGSLHRDFRLWVTISHRLADYYGSVGVPREKILVLPDAVDTELFTRPAILPESPYQSGRPVVAYAGHLYDYKGIPTILAAAAQLPEIEFHLVGGWPEDVARHQETAAREGLRNLTFHGLKNHAEVPAFLWHASVLLLPPSADHPSAAWTSPVKLGEYLASGTPVIATSIPALRDWVTEEEVAFIRPDDPEDMVHAIRGILAHKEYAEGLQRSALDRARELTYTKRAQRVLDRIQEMQDHRATANDRMSGSLS